MGREVVSGEFEQATGIGAPAPTVGYGSAHGPRVCVPPTIFVIRGRHVVVPPVDRMSKCGKDGHMTVAEIHSVLWDVSSDALRDATDMRSLVKERDSSLALRRAQMPEEATTINLARRIAVAFSAGQRDRAAVVLHTRGLEGGNNSQGQKSKADLELCIEVARGKYCDLVLQAKRLSVKSGSVSRYMGWDPSDNQQLIQWAQTNNQTPGMILYSEELPNLFPNLPLLNNICKNAQGHNNGGYYPEWRSGNYGRSAHLRAPTHPRGPRTPDPCVLYPGTPAGIIICLNQHYMTTLTDPSPDDVWDLSFPWEHLMHGSIGSGYFPGGGGGAPTPVDQNDRGSDPDYSRTENPHDEAFEDPGGGVQIKNYLPDWAAIALELAGTETSKESRYVEDERYDRDGSEWAPPTVSIVIQLGDR